MQKKAPHC